MVADTAQELYEQFYPRVLRFALSLTHGQAEAEDLTQETFLRALGNLDALEALSGEQRLSWLFRTAKNIFLDGKRREKLAQRENRGEDEYADDLSRFAVAAFVQRLPESERAIFCLRYFSGYDSGEIGERFGLKPSTVRARLLSARARLKKMYFED
jgi:RNA polymerase sigma-70 factor (ECF subfamily)